MYHIDLYITRQRKKERDSQKIRFPSFMILCFYIFQSKTILSKTKDVDDQRAHLTTMKEKVRQVKP